MKFNGRHWWVEHNGVVERDIKEAIIRNNEIAIDYEYDNKQIHIRLKGENGILFIGEYGTTKKIGDCEFTLYKNEEGYLLNGGYSSSEEGSGNWWVELKPVVE